MEGPHSLSVVTDHNVDFLDDLSSQFDVAWVRKAVEKYREGRLVIFGCSASNITVHQMKVSRKQYHRNTLFQPSDALRSGAQAYFKRDYSM